MEPEVDHGETEVYAGVQATAGSEPAAARAHGKEDPQGCAEGGVTLQEVGL
jgi:hypothetical protein